MNELDKGKSWEEMSHEERAIFQSVLNQDQPRTPEEWLSYAVCLSPLQYDRERQLIAGKMGIRVPTLDDEVEARRRPKESSGACATISDPISDPASTPIPAGVMVLPTDHFNYCKSARSIFPILAETNRFFVRGDVVVELTDDGLKPVSPSDLISRLDRFGARVIAHCAVRDRGLALKPKRLSHDKADVLLRSLEARELLPPIHLVSRSPVAVPSSDHDNPVTILGPGYHRIRGGILVTGKHQPQDVELHEAVDAINSLYDEFRFQSGGDKSRAIASLITPALRMGGWIRGFCPIDVGEADTSQAGKGYRNKITLALYQERAYQIAKKNGGVGSLDESLSQAILSGRPFISIDNTRKTLDSQFLESVITWGDEVSVRVPHRGEIQIDATAVTFQMTSNGVETTRDLANRSSIVRIRKQPGEYRFKQDSLALVEAKSAYYLGCIFSVIREWAKAGRQRIQNPGHDFREWAGILGWIVKNIFKGAPLMEGHEAAQVRVSNSALAWLRQVCLAVEAAGRLDQETSAAVIVELCELAGVEIPGLRESADETAAYKHAGILLGRCFQTATDGRLEIDSFEVTRSEFNEYDEVNRKNRVRKHYKFCALRPACPGPTTPQETERFPKTYESRAHKAQEGLTAAEEDTI